MVTVEPPEQASRWDFSQVFELLKQPLQIDPPEKRPYLHSPTSVKSHLNPVSQRRQRNDEPVTSTGLDPSGPKLGDFGPLWDLISKESEAEGVAPSKAPAHPQPVPSNAPVPCSRPAPVTLLQRPSHGTSPPASSTKSSSPPALSAAISSDTSTLGSPRSSSATPIKGIKILKRDTSSTAGRDQKPQDLHQSSSIPLTKNAKPLEIPKSKTKTKANKRSSKTLNKHMEIAPESSADAGSDSSTIVFDQPRTQPAALAFVPAQIGVHDYRQDREDTPPSSYEDKNSFLDSDTLKGVINVSGVTRIVPVGHKNATERRISLMTRLLKDFPEYAQLVSQVGRPPSTNGQQISCPIHVFVDMSNIMVGFHNAAKASRGLDIATRVRRLHMSFANLSLIMERGRQATKRVLVGSDRLPSIDEAEQLGYETNILDRVHKTKHITSRPAKPRKAHGQSSQLSGPETAHCSEERWVEQGVDEILHLKILESLLDTDKPATIVLASGDAAEAEYSGGFLRMVERALQRGWNVELVSFSQVTGFAYKKKEFRTKWGARFRMIDLDHYVEELFD